MGGFLKEAVRKRPHLRRMILKADVMGAGENLRFVLTSHRGSKPKALCRYLLSAGRSQNRIKELKCDLKADLLSSSRPYYAEMLAALLELANPKLCRTECATEEFRSRKESHAPFVARRA